MAKEYVITRCIVRPYEVAIKSQICHSDKKNKDFDVVVYNCVIVSVENQDFAEDFVGKRMPIGCTRKDVLNKEIKATIVTGLDDDGNDEIYVNECVIEKEVQFDDIKDKLNPKRKSIALMVGSFDPVTLGHESIAKRAAALFDTLIVAVGDNMQKHTLFTLDKRVQLLKRVFAAVPNIKICSFQGLTVQYCRQNNISHIVRGLRSAADFDMEYTMAQANRLLCSQVQTIWLPAMPEHVGISSSSVREILHQGGDVKAFVPAVVYADIMKYKNK